MSQNLSRKLGFRPWVTCGYLALAIAPAACGGGSGGSDPWWESVDYSYDLPGFRSFSQPFQVVPPTVSVEYGNNDVPPASSGPGRSRPRYFQIEIDPEAGVIGVRAEESRRPLVEFPIDFYDDSVAFESEWVSVIAGRVSDYLGLLIPGKTSGYDYTSFGLWSEHRSHFFFGYYLGDSFDATAFYFGSATYDYQMPTTGEAVFLGTMRGYSVTEAHSDRWLFGDALLNVNFGTRRVSGSFRDNLEPVDQFPEITVDARIVSHTFIDGKVSDETGAAGDLHGRFFGPDADEVSGAFRMIGDGNTTIGAFAAKK